MYITYILKGYIIRELIVLVITAESYGLLLFNVII
jgi:hypothetical protein